MKPWNPQTLKLKLVLSFLSGSFALSNSVIPMGLIHFSVFPQIDKLTNSVFPLIMHHLHEMSLVPGSYCCITNFTKTQ